MTMPSKRIPGARFLHAPGPTRIPDEVLDAMHRQSIDLADTRLDTWIKDCEAGMQKLVGTDQAEVYIYSANGHGAWEVAIANVLAEGDAALIPSTGHFSEGWAIQTEALDRRVVRTPWKPGFPIDPNVVEDYLRKDSQGDIKAVFVVQTDTSTGITSDVQAIRQAIDAAGHPALYVVDVVSSLAASPFAMDTMGVNLVVGGSQKGLMLPPGMGFVVVDEVPIRPRSIILRQSFTGTGPSVPAIMLIESFAARPLFKCSWVCVQRLNCFCKKALKKFSQGIDDLPVLFLERLKLGRRKARSDFSARMMRHAPCQ